MAFYKLVVAYDGTAYAGWQIQNHAVAVANVMSTTFTHVFKLPVTLIGASRTDAGVHALGQVVRIETPANLDPAIMQRAWSNALPPDIVIRSLVATDNSFHPQANVVQKEYWYHLFVKRPLPFLARYGYYVARPVQEQLLYDALQLFVGTHDFRSFCTGNEHESTVRHIDAINLTFLRRFNAYQISVRGPGFLRYMIRRIVGASLAVSYDGTICLDYVRDILLKKNPEHILPNAPAHGLALMRITYGQ